MAKILVEATQTGYFGHKRIKEGQRFELSDLKVTMIDPKTKESTEKVITAEQQFSTAWMEKVTKEDQKQAPKQKVKFEQNDNVEVI